VFGQTLGAPHVIGTKLPIARHASQVREIVEHWRRRGQSIALVPTMGGLHEGHLALVTLARKTARRVVVSTFVNPAQFAPHEDFDSYPRNEERDWRKLSAAKVDLMYSPLLGEIYPDDFSTRVEVAEITQTLEGISRPHFFAGVTTVCAKLFLQCQPDYVIFGEKDYQQLLVIKRMVKDLGFPIEVVAGPTVRERDGLALSSRNVYLDEAERSVAPLLHAVIHDMAQDLAAGRDIDDAILQGRYRLEQNGFRVDYLQVRDAETLVPFEDTVTRPGRVLVAAYLGRTRLIDNVAINPGA
jgi:pantoate--beta-alanine ligase